MKVRGGSEADSVGGCAPLDSTVVIRCNDDEDVLGSGGGGVVGADR